MLCPITPAATLRYKNKRYVLYCVYLHIFFCPYSFQSFSWKLRRRYPAWKPLQTCEVCVSPKNEAAPDLMSSSRDTVPAPWLPCPHPEGSLYFIHKGAPSIVSDAELGVDASRELMNYWGGVACDKAKGLGISLSDSTELYLRMDAGKCNYYFVDHEYQIIFWLDTVAVDDLNFEACASSPSHLRK